MTVVGALAVRPGNVRETWGGRFAPQHPGSMDGWTVSREELARRLDRTDELVILDPLSFPWEWLRPEDRTIPVVAALPEELDADAISAALGAPLLGHLTPADRLVTTRREVAADLAVRWQLDPSWLVPETPPPPGPGFERARKAVWETIRTALVEAVREFSDPTPVAPMSVWSEDRWLAVLTGQVLERPVQHRPLAGDTDEGADGVSALVLPTGLTSAQRKDLINKAHRGMRPDGLLLLVATVVAGSADDRAGVPSTDELIEELQEATGTMLNALDIRSLRWAEEPLVRGFMFAGAALGHGGGR